MFQFFCVIVVEFVLALTGATMGTLIAFVFPSTMYLHVVSEKTAARLIAKVCSQFLQRYMYVLCKLLVLITKWLPKQ